MKLRNAIKYALLFSVLLGCILGRTYWRVKEPQFWAEDGQVFWVEAQRDGIASLVQPYNGYYHLLPRLAALALRFAFSVENQPVAYLWTAAGIVAALIAFSIPIRLSLWRVMLAGLLPLLLLRTDELPVSLCNLQWFAWMPLLRVVLSPPPPTRLARGLEFAGILLVGLSGPFCLLLLPVGAVRAVWIGRRAPLGRLAAMALCALVQLSAFRSQSIALAHDRVESPSLTQGLAVASGSVATAPLVPQALLAQCEIWIVAASSLSFLAGSVLVIASVYRLFSWRGITLIYFAVGVTVLGFLRVRPDTWSGASFENFERYSFPGRVILFQAWLAVALGPASLPAALGRLVSALVMLTALVGFRFPPREVSRWEEELAAVARGERVHLRVLPSGTEIRGAEEVLRGKEGPRSR